MLAWLARIALCAVFGLVSACSAYATGGGAYAKTAADRDGDAIADVSDAYPSGPMAEAPVVSGSVGTDSITLASREEMLEESDSDAPEPVAQAAPPPAPPRDPSPAPPPPPPRRPVSKPDVAKPAEPKPAPAPAPDPPGAKPPATEGGGSEVAAIRAPLLIYTAQITMAVFEVNASLGEVEALGRELGGFLARRDDRSITIRVPAARFDEAIKRIEKIGDMLHRDVTVEDVTEEFHDLEIRLRSARAVRDRLEQLLTKATKVEESVLIEKELERVAGLIDRMEGRIKFLKDRAAFSTITVTFEARRTEQLNKNSFNLPVPWLYDLGLGRLLAL